MTRSRFALLTPLLCTAFVMSFGVNLSADDPPGVVINRAKDRIHIVGSPSLTVMPGNVYFASHDIYDRETRKSWQLVFRSNDQGKSWKQIARFDDQCWSTLFFIDENLYLMGTTKNWGNMIIRHSSDGGKTWSTPSDDKSGILITGKQLYGIAVPMPVFDGRVWRSFEVFRGEQGYGTTVISAPIHKDLLDRESWTVSDSATLPVDYFGGPRNRLLGGSIIQKPNGDLVDFLSVNAEGTRAAILPITNEGTKVELDLENAFIRFPTNGSQFTVRYDKKSKRYWSLVNQARLPYSFYNILLLISSDDLRQWKTETILLQHIDSKNHGFQRTFWQFDGDDIIAVMGTAWQNGQTANLLTFHRFENFRDLKMSNSASVLGEAIRSVHKTKSFDVEGVNMSVVPFRKGERIIANWSSWKLPEVPSQFNGWSFTRIFAASRADLTVTVKQDCDLFMTTGIHQGVIDLTGWSHVRSGNYRFRPEETGHMSIFKRSAKAGEVIEVPTGSWTGGMLLIPPE